MGTASQALINSGLGAGFRKVLPEKAVGDDDVQARKHRLLRFPHRLFGARPHAGAEGDLEIMDQFGHEFADRLPPTSRLDGDHFGEFAADRHQRRLGDRGIGTGSKHFSKLHDLTLQPAPPLGSLSRKVRWLERGLFQNAFPAAIVDST